MTENTEVVPQETSAPAESAETPKLTELDGLSEFSFGGKKFTPDKFQEILSQHDSWSGQVKEFGETKKFDENLEVDLDNVLQNPHLAQRFKEIYPKKYHGILDRLLKTGQASAQGQQTSQPQQPALPKEFLNEFGQTVNDVRFLKDHIFQAQVETANAKLDAILPPLFKKYPLANEEQVYARAEATLAKDQALSDAAWERLVRESHEGISKKADQFYNQKLKAQLEKGKQGKDVGPGGVTPGQAPKRARNFDDAYEEMIKHIQTR